jgi:hypothetical protein
MNNWHDEYMAEFHRKDLLNDSEQIRLGNLAMRSRVYRPSLFNRTMHSFAGWMISTGKELHERYEIPSTHCHRTTSNSFAR